MPGGYQIPTEEQIQRLKIEVYILIVIYMVTILFVIHNIVRYLWLQYKFKVFQISIFYILALCVLIFRIWQYIGTLILYTDLQDFLCLGYFKILAKDYKPEIDMVRHIGVSQTGSDYSKYALGFYQLQSMCELAVVIRFSVYHIKRKANNKESVLSLDDSMTE